MGGYWARGIPLVGDVLFRGFPQFPPTFLRPIIFFVSAIPSLLLGPGTSRWSFAQKGAVLKVMIPFYSEPSLRLSRFSDSVQ